MNNLSLLFCLVLMAACHTPKETQKPLSQHPYAVDTIISRPQVFHRGTVSTAIDKFNTSMSPDGRVIYYTATSQKLGLTGIAYQHFKNGQFQSPEFVPFVSPDIPVADVQISPDGQTMLFSTFKDYVGKPEGFNFNIWTSRLDESTWQNPEPLGAPIASTGNEFYPVMTNTGRLYFNSDKGGNSDIYYASFENGQYQEPIRLPDNINSPLVEADAFVARDESYLIFVRVDESDGFGQSDLYISFRTGANEWTDPKNMGPTINSDQIDGSPYVTPDGHYLIFTSGRIDPKVKELAMDSYAAFAEVQGSSYNGSLNFYIVSFNAEDYR